MYSEPIDAAPGSTEAQKDGAAETVAKEYVDENIGPGAGLDEGGHSRVRVGLSVQADGGAGGTWSGSRSRKVLGDVLVEVGNTATGPGDYMIVQIGDALFEFQWHSPYWGLDKREGNGVRRPVLFSARMGNVENISSSVSYMAAASGVVVYGQGVGELLKPGTAYDTTLTTITSWARKQLIRLKRDTVTQASLNNAAYAALIDNQVEVSVASTVKEIVSCRYNVHWGVGDLVTVADTIYGRQINRKVTGVQVSLEAEGTQGGVVKISPELGDYVDVS